MLKKKRKVTVRCRQDLDTTVYYNVTEAAIKLPEYKLAVIALSSLKVKSWHSKYLCIFISIYGTFHKYSTK